MGGLLTHLSVAVIGFLIGTFGFKNYKFGLGFFIGSLLPDIIDFGVLGLVTWSFSPSQIMAHPLFRTLAILGHTWWHWIILGIGIFAIVFILYKLNKISIKKFKIWSISVLFLVIGAFVHLLIDKFIQETSYWI